MFLVYSSINILCLFFGTEPQNEGHRNRNDHRVERKPVPLPVQLPSTPFQSPIEPVTGNHIKSPQSPFSGFPPPPGFRQKLLAPGTPYNWDLIPNALVVDSEPHQPVIPRTPPAPPNTAINNRPHQMGPTQRYLQGVLPPHATERHENPLTPPGYRSPTRQGIEDITLLTNPTWRLGEPLTLPAGPGHYPLRPENLVGQLSTQDVADQGISRIRHYEDSVSQGLIISNAISNYNEPVLGLQTPPTIRELLEESLLSSQASSEWNLMNIQGRQANNNPFRSPQ